VKQGGKVAALQHIDFALLARAVATPMCRNSYGNETSPGNKFYKLESAAGSKLCGWQGGHMREALKLQFSMLVFSVAMAMAMVGCGGSGTSSMPGQQPAALGATVDAIAHAAMQQQGIPGMTVALAKKGAMLYVQGYGTSDLATQQPAQPGIIFELGSITKQFTAALIMKLQEQGRLRVDDSIALYLPEYNFPSAITLRMMLTHTSGLANFTDFAQLGDWVRHGVSEATVLTAVSQSPLQFQPGTQCSYSNSNFFALGTIIERLTGQSYAANLQQHIFQPLKMMNTYYSLPPAEQSAVGYTNNGSGLVPAILWDRSAAFAAGGLSSTVYDIVAWDDALINGKVVSPASFTAMTTSNGFQIPGGGSYGFGLALWTFNNRPIIWHNGQIGGFTAETAVFLDSGFTVVVLTNDQDADPDAVVLQIMKAVCNSSPLGGNC
jgi:D-alanyl-D-alanine carboxypeptidase